jgi:hypothetical protein
MNADIQQGSHSMSRNTKPLSASAGTLLLVRLNPIRLGLAFGATGVVFYLGCMLTMATVPREKAVVFFNSLLHGLNVEPILKTSVPTGEAVLGLVTTFILGWFAGVLIAGFYNIGILKADSSRESA